MKRWLALTLALVLVTGAGCDQLGNPDVSMQHTPAASWTDGANRLDTRTFTVPPERSNELLRAIAPVQPHYVDFFAPSDGVVTLVVVQPELAFVPRVPELPLVTRFRLRDGTVMRRRWSAPLLAPRFYAGFGLPERPVEAVTAIDH
jgi:hypothetical protein